MIRGTVRFGHRTKSLVPRLRPGEIAVIAHPDLDEVAADSLRRAKVRAVINTAPSITGRYPNLGPSLLLAAGVPLLDAPRWLRHTLRDGDQLAVDQRGRIFRNGTLLAIGLWLTQAVVAEKLQAARANLPAEVERFIDNTLQYAQREKRFILEPLPLPPLQTKLAGRHALVVVRGHNYRADLRALRSYVDELEPVLIGVDGGADALLEAGWRPQIIVGDMDSVSDAALRAADDVVVHGYTDGRAPGLARPRSLGISAHVIHAPGTSEDLAMLLAYEAGAELIVAVGSHSNYVDFLEKGRPGMASTFLVRLKIGARLVDARGVSQLYRARTRLVHPLQVALAAMVPASIVVALSTPLRQWLKLVWLQLRVWTGL